MKNSLLRMVENEQTSEFYPTPKSLVKKMIENIKWSHIQTILEPSAGKGDILREIAKEVRKAYRDDLDVDCIEIDPNLRQILKYNFGERLDEIKHQMQLIKDKYSRYNDYSYEYYNDVTEKYETIPQEDYNKIKEFEEEKTTFFRDGIHIVHDNFLTYNPLKRYDLIIMNPPFSEGDKHLLKALEMQKKGGNVVCLLNAETLRNPYTETRKELLRQLDKYNATIEYINEGFIKAERKTNVEVALIKIFIEQTQEESDIFNRMQESEKMEDFDLETTELEVSDYIKAAVNRFNIEAKSGIELIRQYKALSPYILNSLDEENRYREPMLKLSTTSVNEYLECVRGKYWRALLLNPKFSGKLTSKLRSEYQAKVGRLSKYDFTEFNIYTLSAELNTQIKKGIEDEIVEMFDRLTSEHTWYPECSKNRHYYNGWKTNKAHKIDKKVIIPCYGVFDDWDGKPRTYNAQKILEDIEKILNYFDGHMTREVDSWDLLEWNFRQGITKNIIQKFYTVTFYKKGTVHITFTCPELIERFNIYIAQNKQWLPPAYGKKTYKDMTEEEKEVIDSFQGEEAYNKVMEKPDFYLAPVVNNQMLMLGA